MIVAWTRMVAAEELSDVCFKDTVRQDLLVSWMWDVRGRECLPSLPLPLPLLLFIYLFLYSRFLLVICFIPNSVYMSIPVSHFIPLPPNPQTLSRLGVHTFVLYICVSIPALQTGSSVPSPYF